MKIEQNTAFYLDDLDEPTITTHEDVDFHIHLHDDGFCIDMSDIQAQKIGTKLLNAGLRMEKLKNERLAD